MNYLKNISLTIKKTREKLTVSWIAKSRWKGYTRKAVQKLYFHCGPLKKQNLGTIRIKIDA